MIKKFLYLKKKTIEKIINEEVNLWYGIYISNKKVGWFNGSYNKFNDDLYKIEEKLYLLIDMPGLEEGNKITTEKEITSSMLFENTFPYRMVKYNEHDSSVMHAHDYAVIKQIKSSRHFKWYNYRNFMLLNLVLLS